MKTEEQLNRDILDITMKIQNEFPELTQYLKETPVNISENSGHVINRNSLEDYYDSLNELLKKYSDEHQKNGQA